MFKFTLPHGEPAFGHVMEFIDGSRASDQRADSLGLDHDEIFNLVGKDVLFWCYSSMLTKTFLRQMPLQWLSTKFTAVGLPIET